MRLLNVVLLAGALMGLGSAAAQTVDLGAESASHEELEPLAIEFESLTALRLHPNGHLLACDGKANQIKVIGPEGRPVDTIQLDFGPEAVDVAPDGTIFCGGRGRLAKLDERGKLLKTGEVPRKEVSDKQEVTAEDSPQKEDAKSDASANLPRRRRASRPQRVSGIAVCGEDLFVAFGAGWSLGSKSKLFRLDLELEHPKLLAEGLRGCCQRCDVAAFNGILYLAENSAHRVVSYNRDGDMLGKWGERSRTDLEGFGACCNPMNLCFDDAGVLYTAESGMARVKRHATDGEFLGLVGYVGTERFRGAGGLAASCSNIAIAVTPDGSRVYVMDYKKSLIRVLQKKDGADGH